MNGAVITSNSVMGSITSDWKITDGAGDYNGDGKSDIFWQNDNGVLVSWLMDGATTSASAYVGALSGDWHVQGG